MEKFRTRSVVLLIFMKLIGDIEGNVVLESLELPNQSYMPTLSNGHVGFEVYGTAIYMNGLYNGPSGNSHRARIPNYSNYQIPQCNSSNQCIYRMNLTNGVFENVYETLDYTITQQIYPHRYYNRAIVNKITLRRLRSAQLISIRLDRIDGGNSVDLFNEKTDFINDRDFSTLKSFYTTRVVEDIRYQYEPTKVYVAYTQKSILDLPANVNSVEVLNVVTIGHTEEEVVKQLNDVLNSTSLLESHAREWENFWRKFEISVDGDEELNRVMHSSIFYLVSNLPSINANQQNDRFYGLSPSGLGKPHYQGHSFWDTEIWMHPPILLMEPKWSEDLLNYRYHTRRALKDNAKELGYCGYRYPWESAFTGTEVTDFCCPDIAKYQHHITGDVAFAYRSHLSATFDDDWFEEYGCEVAYNTAKFWASRVAYNSSSKLLDLKNVMGPDEFHQDVSNNAYTNVIAAMNLYFGEFAGCVCKDELNLDKTEYQKFSKIAKNLTILHDSKKNFHPQFDGYVIGSEIKQADTVLLGYPLQYPMDAKTKKNNLEFYENVTASNGPAMTWAMHAIGFLDLREFDKAAQLFKKSYRDYVREPFLTWYEVAPGHTGAENFITGAGGFLQTIINGYAGIRLHFGSLSISNFKLPPKTRELHLKGISYMKSRFNLDIWESSANISFSKLDDDKKIDLIIDGFTKDLKENVNYTIKENSTAILHPRKYPFGKCMLKDTVLGGAASRFEVPKLLVFAIVCLWRAVF